MIREMDLVYLHGQMVGDMKDSGKMGNNMAKANILARRERKNRVNGKEERR